MNLINSHTVQASPRDVELFNRAWPGSRLSPDRGYWFAFDGTGDLIDHDVPEQDDGREAWALSEDCRDWALYGTWPAWLP